jgi:hypothetical protein
MRKSVLITQGIVFLIWLSVTVLATFVDSATGIVFSMMGIYIAVMLSLEDKAAREAGEEDE